MPSNGDRHSAGRHAVPQPAATPAAPVRAAANADARGSTPSEASGQAVGIARLAAGAGAGADPARQRLAARQPPLTLVALHRAVGNAAVQRLLQASVHGGEGSAPPALQRQPGGNQSSRRQGVVSVRWSEDRVEFTHRLSAAVARSLRVDAEVLLTPLLTSAAVRDFHFAHARGGKHKEGARLQVQVGLDYHNPGKWEASVSGIAVSDPASGTPGKETEPTKPEPSPARHQPKPNETLEERIARQTTTSAEILGRTVARADERGLTGVAFVIAFTGKEIEPRMMEPIGPVQPHQSGTMRMSAQMAEASLRRDVDALVDGGPGEMVIQFMRDNRGIMHHQKWWRRPLPPTPKPGAHKPRTEREMLDEYGIPDPKKMWTEIGERWEAEVKDAGMMVLTFALTEIATWIIGGAILKILGTGLSKLPRLYRAIRGKNAKAIEEGLARLGKSEADELGHLMERAKRGEQLSAAETKRLEEVAGKLDEAMGSGAKAGGQVADDAAVAGAGRGAVNRSTPDYYLVVDAAEPIFSAEAQLVAGGELKLVIRTEFQGQRSAALRGSEQFQAILRHFSGKVRGIKGEWTYETNLMKFNELTAGGKSAREAALGTWTGEQAAANGYRNVIVRTLDGTPGSYTKVDVLFVP
jgi:hypothetical protein